VGHYEAGAKRKVQQTKNVREIWRETKTSDGIVIKAILHTIIGSNNNVHCGTTLSSGIIDTELVIGCAYDNHRTLSVANKA